MFIKMKKKLICSNKTNSFLKNIKELWSLYNSIWIAGSHFKQVATTKNRLLKKMNAVLEKK